MDRWFLAARLLDWRLRHFERRPGTERSGDGCKRRALYHIGQLDHKAVNELHCRMRIPHVT
jgi:hypothetical protein